MMQENILNIIKPIFGNKCCRVRVGAYKSLSMGFGKKIYHNKPYLVDAYYGEWEIGTYYCAWRIMKANRILCGTSDTVESIDELNRNVNAIEFGKLIFIRQLSDIDIRLEFDREIYVDFLATISDEDEYFHIFCPDNVYIELSIEGKWTIGKSTGGWPN